MISNDSKDSRDQHPDEEEILEASVPGHPNDLQKTEISKWVADGMGLSEVQKKIDDEFGIVMTYMDVRFLVDDLNLTLVDEEEPEPQLAGANFRLTSSACRTAASAALCSEESSLHAPSKSRRAARPRIFICSCLVLAIDALRRIQGGRSSLSLSSKELPPPPLLVPPSLPS